NLNLTWLAPIVYHKTIDGGTVMPVKFTLDNNGTFVRDETVLISIYEVFADGSIGQPVVFPYGGTNPDMPDYAINGTVYQIDFKTASGVHKYRVEVYKPLDNTGTNLQLLGTENILTKKAGKSCKSDKSSKSDKSDKSCKSNKSDKGSKGKGDCKSNKSDKSSKSGKSGYGGKDNCGKSGKSGSGHYGKSDKSGKSGYGNYGKSDKSGKSSSGSKGKSDKSSKSGSYGGGSNQNGNCPPSSSQSSQSSRGYGSSWGRR
ncbi:MAG: hypothetical protein IT582_04740, partial [Opitutaceae bacterium]|nr:hypothetical protein [Opitutaceae bacterium]